MVWLFVVAGIHQGSIYSASLALVAIENSTYDPVNKLSFVQITGFYAFMAFVTLFYPLSGFIADVYCGRYRVVTISLGIIFLALVLICFDVVLFKIFQHEKLLKGSRFDTLLYVLAYSAFIIAIPGLSGFYANIAQLSVDQLQDAPSHSLGVCLHWMAWTDQLGNAIVHLFFVTETCTSSSGSGFKTIIQSIALCLPSTFLMLLSILIVLNCFAKRFFHTEFVRYNPYKMISKVLNYARKNKHARWRSALHCNNNRIPTRIDFAKETYGGPFTTPDVEDVKTFIRVFVVLLAIGPVFVLCVPTSYYLFPIYSFHTVGRSSSLKSICTVKWTLLESGTLSEIVALAVLPVIIWLVYAVRKNRVPKIFTRLGISLVLFIMSVLSMLVPDLIGHGIRSGDDSFINGTQCMFIENYFPDDPQTVSSLDLPWYILIIPNCLMRVAECLVLATSFEFISAQTPQSMKGVLFGVFFAVKGLFTFLGAVLLVPFALPFWNDVHSPVVNCGFGYFMLTSVIAVVGFVSFVCVVRRYRYRERDEEPYCQADIEEIFSRRLEQERRMDNSPEVVVQDPHNGDRRHSDRGGGYIVTGGGTCRRERSQSVGVGERSLSMSHNWYGTFDNHDNGANSDKRTKN